MKKSWNLLWAFMLALPAYAQDPATEVPAGETPAADNGGSIPYEAPPSDASAAPADASAADAPAADAAPAETPPSDTASSEAPAEETPSDSTPWHLYGGADWVQDTLSASTLSGYAADTYDSGMYRLRGGARLFDAIGAEFQIGLDKSDEDKAGSPATKTKSYYGLFLVPTASVFETVELAFPVGYAMSKFERPGASASLNSLAYGINAELPIRVFSANLPNLRVGAGWMVYYQKVDARAYGFNAGLRYDFDVDGGNPFSGMSGMGDSIGGFFKSLWPFGGDDAAPAQ